MKDKVFVDSNIFLYLFSNDETKKRKAIDILKSHPIVSIQVILEDINVLLKKFTSVTTQETAEHSRILMKYCFVCPLTTATIEKAIELKMKYRFQWYDCTILSAAILESCSIIYSEDLQHGQFIDGKLKIVNPFV